MGFDEKYDFRHVSLSLPKDLVAQVDALLKDPRAQSRFRSRSHFVAWCMQAWLESNADFDPAANKWTLKPEVFGTYVAPGGPGAASSASDDYDDILNDISNLLV